MFIWFVEGTRDATVCLVGIGLAERRPNQRDGVAETTQAADIMIDDIALFHVCLVDDPQCQVARYDFCPGVAITRNVNRRGA